MNHFSSKMLSFFVESTPEVLVKKYIGSMIPIFMLHRLCSPDQGNSKKYLSHVKWCLSYIRKHKYIPISLEALVKNINNGTPLNPKSVVFTIDDGFYEHYEIGSPLFSEFDIPLTCFVITDFLDSKLWPWDDQIAYILSRTKIKNLKLALPANQSIVLSLTTQNLSLKITELRNILKTLNQTSMYHWLDYLYETAEVEKPKAIPEYYRPMSWPDAQKFIDSGHNIAPHTKTHRILSQLTEDEATNEILHSCDRVEKMLLNTSKVFAYPTGRLHDYNHKNIATLQTKKMLCSVNTIVDYFDTHNDLYSMPRFSLPNNRFDFIQYLSFFEAFKNKLRSKNRFLKSIS